GRLGSGTALIGSATGDASPRGAVAVEFGPLARSEAVGGERGAGVVVESGHVGCLWSRGRHSGAARAVSGHRPPRVRHSALRGAEAGAMLSACQNKPPCPARSRLSHWPRRSPLSCAGPTI